MDALGVRLSPAIDPESKQVFLDAALHFPDAMWEEIRPEKWDDGQALMVFFQVIYTYLRRAGVGRSKFKQVMRNAEETF